MPSCHSTNDKAQQLAQKTETAEGTVVICTGQTHGKGQRGNTWEAEAGSNLTLSVILRPTFLEVKRQFYLNMVASLAVKEMLNQLGASADLRVKWPNDVLCGQKKISGILIENTLNQHLIDTSVIGFGVNVNQTGFRAPKATSMRLLSGRVYELDEVYEQLMVALEGQYMRLKAGRFSEVKADYLHGLFGYMEPKKYISEYQFEGKIEDVTDEGRLLIRGPQGRKAYDLKEITFVY